MEDRQNLADIELVQDANRLDQPAIVDDALIIQPENREPARPARRLGLNVNKYGAMQVVIMAKKFISALLRLLAVLWMIVAYYMIRSMELKS